MFEQQEIIVGVCGGVSAYKTADLVSKLVQLKANVSVVMTQAAKQFIGEATFNALTNRPVHSDMFAFKEHYLGEHIGLVRRAKLMVIAPATADFLAKAAHGHADDLLSTLMLTATCPVLLAPAMNVEMWSKKVVQRNISLIKEEPLFEFIDPGTGYLSCQVEGKGRMAEPGEILGVIEQKLKAAEI